VTIEALLEGEESTTTAAARLADDLAEAEGIGLLEAYDWVQAAVLGTLDEAAQERLVRYQGRIEELRRLFSHIGQQRMAATVTAIVRHRLVADWTLEDTRNQLSRGLFDAIWQFAEEERQRQSAPPPGEDELKKRSPGRSTRRTGKRSRGPSADTTPVVSDGTDSPQSPPAS
jgi:hypothetical protein